MNKKAFYAVALVLAMVAPFALYPVFLMKVLCFALFACAFNLLIGFTGLLSFGHAAFFGGAGYVAGYALKSLGLPTELGLILGTAIWVADFPSATQAACSSAARLRILSSQAGLRLELRASWIA